MICIIDKYCTSWYYYFACFLLQNFLGMFPTYVTTEIYRKGYNNLSVYKLQFLNSSQVTNTNLCCISYLLNVMLWLKAILIWTSAHLFCFTPIILTCLKWTWQHNIPLWLDRLYWWRHSVPTVFRSDTIS